MTAVVATQGQVRGGLTLAQKAELEKIKESQKKPLPNVGAIKKISDLTDNFDEFKTLADRHAQSQENQKFLNERTVDLKAQLAQKDANIAKKTAENKALIAQRDAAEKTILACRAEIAAADERIAAANAQGKSAVAKIVAGQKQKEEGQKQTEEADISISATAFGLIVGLDSKKPDFNVQSIYSQYSAKQIVIGDKRTIGLVSLNPVLAYLKNNPKTSVCNFTRFNIIPNITPLADYIATTPSVTTISINSSLDDTEVQSLAKAYLNRRGTLQVKLGNVEAKNKFDALTKKP